MYDLSQRLLFRRAMTWLVLFVIALGAYGTTTALQPRMALAQDEDAAAEGTDSASAPKKPADESLLVFTYKALGPFYVVVFLVISFVFVALVVMVALMLRRDQICPSGLAEMFESHLNEKRFQEAYELAKADESMLGQVLAAGMSKVQQGHEAAQKAMQDVGDERVMDMEQKIGYLGLIGTISPLLGLMGTVDGMVVAFRVIANSDQTPKPNELAQGITMALVTTQIGLYIAVPAVILFAWFKNRLAKLFGRSGCDQRQRHGPLPKEVNRA